MSSFTLETPINFISRSISLRKLDKLFSVNNTLLTPHNAALTLECRKRMSVESCENVFDFLTNSKNLNKSNIINLNIFD